MGEPGSVLPVHLLALQMQHLVEVVEQVAVRLVGLVAVQQVGDFEDIDGN